MIVSIIISVLLAILVVFMLAKLNQRTKQVEQLEKQEKREWLLKVALEQSCHLTYFYLVLFSCIDSVFFFVLFWVLSV
jgi:hypothetical protein